MHFYGGAGERRAPFAVPEADAPTYRELMHRLGLSRVVSVQSLLYGVDNSIMLSGVEQLGDAARAVAVIDPAADDQSLLDLAGRGVRGVRAFMLFDPVYDWRDLSSLSKRIAALGWHLQVQLNGRELPERLDVLENLGCRLVIDHTGKFIDPVGVDDPAFLALRRLVAKGNTWVKLSAPYETSKFDAPYKDVSALARTLVDDAPERMIWGTNWPHPNRKPAPDDIDLLQWFAQVAPESVRQKILVDNPAELFGFAAN